MFDVVQVVEKRLFVIATGAAAELQRALVDHDGEGEAGMLLDLLHDFERSDVGRVAGAVPVNDEAVDAAADHVLDLFVDLGFVPGDVADLHVAMIAEPGHEVSDDLSGRAGIEQRADIKLADIGGGHIAIGLRLKTIRRACVVGGFGSKRSSRHLHRDWYVFFNYAAAIVPLLNNHVVIACG